MYWTCTSIRIIELMNSNLSIQFCSRKHSLHSFALFINMNNWKHLPFKATILTEFIGVPMHLMKDNRALSVQMRKSHVLSHLTETHFETIQFPTIFSTRYKVAWACEIFERARASGSIIWLLACFNILVHVLHEAWLKLRYVLIIYLGQLFDHRLKPIRRLNWLKLRSKAIFQRVNLERSDRIQSHRDLHSQIDANRLVFRENDWTKINFYSYRECQKSNVFMMLTKAHYMHSNLTR